MNGRIKRLPNGRYQFRWRDKDGVQRARNFRYRERAQQFVRDLERGRFDAPDAPLTFAEFAALWHKDYCVREKAPSQHMEDQRVIANHLNPALGHRQLSEITKLDLERFRRELQDKRHPRSGRPLSPKTLNLVLSQLKQMLAQAVEWELLGESPAAKLKLFRKAERATNFWTADERDFFVRFCRPLDPALAELVLVACRTGLRRGELAGLTRRQLDFDGEQILVDAVWCFKSDRRLERTKNLRVAFVPMDDEVKAALGSRRLAAPDARVFDLEVFRNLSVRLRRMCRRLGVKEVRFHDLRHTFASTLVAQGVPIYSVQRLMRHETAAMTQRYAHLSPGDLREAIRALSRGRVHDLCTSAPGETSTPNNVVGLSGAADRI